ncbi:MAG: hypothetical protein ACFFCQ_12760, partial [Promethearchaeota archaeon]
DYKVLGTFLMFCVLLGIKERKSGIPIKELARNRKLHQNTVKTHIIQLQEKGYVSLDLKTNMVIPTDQLFCEINLQETYKQLSALLNGKSNLFQGY